MPRVTSLDGKTYEIDAETLAACQIPDEEVKRLGLLPDLPAAPPPVPPVMPRRAPVQVRSGPGGTTVIDLNLAALGFAPVQPPPKADPP